MKTSACSFVTRLLLSAPQILQGGLPICGDSDGTNVASDVGFNVCDGDWLASDVGDIEGIVVLADDGPTDDSTSVGANVDGESVSNVGTVDT